MNPPRFSPGRSRNSGENFSQRIFLRVGGQSDATVPEIITENIIKQLEQGVAPWRKPWSTSMPPNLIAKKPYRGLNVLLLATQGYRSPYWVTFHQTKTAGAQKRGGLTAAGRKRLSELMKKRWAERRKKVTAKH